MLKFRSESGFSLIELSFSIAIFATALIIISNFFINSLGSTSQSLRYQALALSRSTLEEYKTKQLKDLSDRVDDYGQLTGYSYDTKHFKRKIDIDGDKLKRITVTIYWRKRNNQEQQVSLTTLRSTKAFNLEKKDNNYNRAIKGLLIAKQNLHFYKQNNEKFPAWDKRSGTLKKVADYYDDFTTKINNPDQFSYRNPSFYDWWAEGYLLIYKQPLDDKYYCITNDSGIYTIPAKERNVQQILGDMFANSHRDQQVFKTHATKFREDDQIDSKN
jgi:prepilin-type N-terminal cleavage/methylation domain-containing protein